MRGVGGAFMFFIVPYTSMIKQIIQCTEPTALLLPYGQTELKYLYYNDVCLRKSRGKCSDLEKDIRNRYMIQSMSAASAIGL